MANPRQGRTGLNDAPTNPMLPDLFRQALRSQALAMRTHSIGTIVSYNNATQRATVSVDILQVIKDLRTDPTPANPNPTKVQPPVVLKDIPVYWPRSGTGPASASLTLPLVPGDKGELHVQDRSLDAWLELGQAVDPVASWTHALSDSVFHPARFDDASPLPVPTSLTAAVLDGPLVSLGALAASPLVKGDQLSAAFTAYTAAVATAFGEWGGVLPPTSASNGKFIAALGAANTALASTVATWLSTKSLTE